MYDKINRLLLTSFTLMLLACGESTTEKVDRIIEMANENLSAKNCDKALELLHSIDYQWNNVNFLQTYASAYACKGGFSEPTFFGQDLDKLSASESGFLGSLTTFSTSPMSSASDTTYSSLLAGINALLYAGVGNASSEARRQVFSDTQVNNMDMQALYMILALMGKYFYYYGNVNSAGVKGAGSGTNGCLINYTQALAQAGINNPVGSTGSCDTFNEGHSGLTSNTTRMCEGIILFNNFVDIISHVTIPGSNTGNLSELSNIFNSLCLDDGTIDASICTIKDLATCKEQNLASIEVYFAFLFEKIFL